MSLPAPPRGRTFASDLLAQLEGLAGRGALPRVRGVHLPPDPPPGAERGEFCALELDDGSLGLSYVLLGDTLPVLRQHSLAAGGDALALARRFVQGATLAERALGLAAANALTRWLFDRAGFVPPASRDSIAGLDPQPGEAIGMVGLFRPLIARIVERGARLTVVELRADLAGEHAGWRVTTDTAALRGCSQVLATGTLLLNDTLDDVLRHCRGAHRVALVGPSLGCLPDALFARGVTLLGGSWVLDGPAYVDTLRSGGGRNPHARKFTLAADAYPGLPALLARL